MLTISTCYVWGVGGVDVFALTFIFLSNNLLLFFLCIKKVKKTDPLDTLDWFYKEAGGLGR
jgi:hypothetical protein